MSIKDKYKVESIKPFETYDWLKNKHYAKRIPPISYAFGLFQGNGLNGVCCFGIPASRFENIKQPYELNRLVINDDLDKNVLSYFVSQSLSIIKGYNIIVSFSDINMKHHGYIYQACNFIYTGKSSNTTQLIDKEGKEFHFRNIGHYQKKLKGNKKFKHIKRRLNEDTLDRIVVANYLRKNKGSYTAKQIDKIFGYKDTAAHWFRLDKGFSYPSVDDWVELKEILSLDDTLDSIMLNYEWIPCASDIIEQLELQKIEILPKHRYIYIIGNKRKKADILKHFQYEKIPYPKGDNKKYDASYKPITQMKLF